MRFTGQGCIMMIGSNVLNFWWIKKRGMVTGLSGSLQQIFQNGILPVLMLKLITEYGVMVTFNYIS